MPRHAPDSPAFPAFVDDRGVLVAVEFSELGFRPMRAFVVVAASGPTRRGGHRADCTELLVLAHGRALVEVVSADGSRACHPLAEPGAQVLLRPDDHVEYELLDDGSVLMVLADRAFRAREEPPG